MSLTNRVVLEWADGEFEFALGGKEVRELQSVCGFVNKDGIRQAIGFGAIYQRMSLGVWFDEDIYHTIRLGLIGGGMNFVEAKRKADMYAAPPYRAGEKTGSEQVALAIIGATMHGIAAVEPPPGERQAGT